MQSVHVQHHLDDVLNEIRQCLSSQRDPVIIKIANAEAEQELCVFKLRVEDDGVLSYCERDTDGVVEDDDTSRVFGRQRRLVSHARSRAAVGTAQESSPAPSQTVDHPTSFSHQVQQELKEQQLRIVHLELTLSRTQDELRRALQGDISASADQVAHDRTSTGVIGSANNGINADSSTSSSSSSSSSCSSISHNNASVSQAAADMSRLRLQHENIDRTKEDDEAAVEQCQQEEEDHGVDASASTTSEQDSDAEEGSDSRRSGRQRKAVDHLQYPAPTPTASVCATKRKLTSTATVPSTAKKIKRQSSSRVAHESAPPNVVVEDSDEVQIAALVSKLQEAHSRRSDPAIDSCSSTTLAKVVHDMAIYSGSLASGKVSMPLPPQQQQQSPPMTMQQCAVQITTLINTSTSLKMLGYFLRAVLAHKLKRTSDRNYCRLAREMLDIKSPADLAAYPAFFDFVQQRCSTVVITMFSEHENPPTDDSSGIEELLRQPIFMVDICWSDWRKYLAKPHRHIVEAAFQRFTSSIRPYQDWMQLGWVEVYDDEQLNGQGVRAVRDIHLPRKHGGKSRVQDIDASISTVAVDLACAGSEFLLPADDPQVQANPTYMVQVGRQIFDGRRHWMGKINHLPSPYCNLRLDGRGKLVQTKEIKVGDALTFDYAMEYWVRRVTGMDISEWLSERHNVAMRNRHELFTRMHRSVHDYTSILRQPWSDSLTPTSSAVDKETVLVELEDYLDTVSEQ